MHDGSALALQQMVTEPNMWRTVSTRLGLLMLLRRNSFVAFSSSTLMIFYCWGNLQFWILWWTPSSPNGEISSPEEIDSVTRVRFLGTQLFREGRRWWVTQKNYLQDLLNRNLGPTPWTKRKVPMLAEPDSRQDPPNHNLETTREAQRVVGELVWVATRSRPDLSFSVTRLTSLISRDPQLVLDLVQDVWYYLAGTLDQGLLFQNDPEERQLNIFTDASVGEICTGCHLVMWGSSMLLWKSGK